MRSMKSVLTVLLAVLLLLPLNACGVSGGGGVDTTQNPGVIVDPPDTAPTIVPSPSLESPEAVSEIGIQTADMILSGVKTLGKGKVYDGLNPKGKPLFKASNEEEWAVRPNIAIPEDFPTLVTSVGTEISLINHTAYEVISDQYVNFSSGETYELADIPAEAAVYIRVVTVEIPSPTSYLDVEVGTFFGEVKYFFVISFE